MPWAYHICAADYFVRLGNSKYPLLFWILGFSKEDMVPRITREK